MSTTFDSARNAPAATSESQGPHRGMEGRLAMEIGTIAYVLGHLAKFVTVLLS